MSDYSPIRLYSVASAAEQLETSTDYVYDRIKAGELAVVELGHSRTKQRISAPELLKFIEARSYPRANPEPEPDR
ncbi:hypothetical protein [Subtercola boreus]|nr:hypothetical protein [Subtercola boreus]